MNIIKMIKTKRAYVSPEIVKIKLDNEISLVLASGDPPIAPGEGKNNIAPQFFNNDPFRNNA